MKTDKIFYTLFQVFPELLFQLLGEPPELAKNYQFQSVEVKELAFTLDGVYIPSENRPDDPLYFVEVQFQKDEGFYWRFITETFMYIDQYKPLRPCYIVVLWGKESLDQGLPLPYQTLLDDRQIKKIYLDQINQKTTRSLGFGLIEFITSSERKAREQVPSLINQAKQEINDEIFQKEVIELIEKIIIYKFPKKSRQEIENMFNLVEWKQTQFYKDVKLEGELEGKLEGKLEGLQEGKIKTVPLLLRLGLTPEQISQELEIDIEKVLQVVASQNN